MTKNLNITKSTSLVLCGLFTALMAVGAFIKIMLPIGIWQVTFSLQIFFAVMAGMFLGSKNGFYSVLAYVLVGLMGVPVFAHGGGIQYMMKPTFGFIIGFIAAAWISGLVTEGKSGKGMGKLILAAFLGEMAYYFFGLLYYFIMYNYVLTNGKSIGVVALIEVWFLSTVIPDFIICALAAVTYNRIYPLVKNYIC